MTFQKLYATMIASGQTRLERQFATSFQWLLIEEQLTKRLDGGPLHRNSAIVALLVEAERRTSIIVQHLVSTPFDDDPEHAVEVLDAHLTDFATMAMLPMSSE